MVSFKDIKTKVSSGVKKMQTAVTTKWDYDKTLKQIRDRKNFEIDKQGRFAARCFQVLLAVVLYYWLGSQNGDFINTYKLGSVHAAMIAFSILSPVTSGFLVAVYVAPWFSHAWTSRRILSVETFFDIFMTLGWISGFIVEMSSAGMACNNGNWDPGCTNFNWLMSWLFFLFLSWGAGVYFDCTAWYRGVFAADEIESSVLMDVRRTTRTSRY